MFPKSHPLRICVIATLAFGMFLFTSGAASAQTEDIDPYIEVEDDGATNPDVVDDGATNPDTAVIPSAATPAVQGESVSRSSALPLTGSEILVVAFVGLGLVAGGAAVLIGSRRRRAVS